MTIVEHEETLLAYVAAWSAPADQRRELIARCWAVDGHYADPQSEAHGRDELHALIGGFQAQMPGARIVLLSGADGHHGLVRFRWALAQADGARLLEGFDVGEVDAAGQLRRISGFFGPFPPAPEHWPATLVDRTVTT